MAAEYSEPRESTRAAEAFNLYCQLGPSRSLAKLSRQDSKGIPSVAQLKRWSVQFNWTTRAREYDEQQRAEQRREHEQAVKEMRMRQIRQSLAQQELSHQVIMDKLAQPKASLYAASQIYKNASDQERALLDDTDKDMIIDELKELAKKRGIKYE